MFLLNKYYLFFDSLLLIFSVNCNLLFAGFHEGPELNYKLQLKRIHETTFGNYETREKVNYEGKVNKHEILPKSKNGKRRRQQTSYFSEMNFKDSLGRCHSLPLNLFKSHNYVTLSHLDDNVATFLCNKSSPSHKHDCTDSVLNMIKPCNSFNETNNSSVSSGKYKKLDILLRNGSVERNAIMNNIISDTSEHNINGKKNRGYFYESVGGVYYSFGNSISEENKDECGIENSLCDETYNDRKTNSDAVVQSDNAKWKDRNLNTISESSDKGEGDSGRQTCSSPISSEDNSNNDKHIYAIARCAANVASLTGILDYNMCQ